MGDFTLPDEFQVQMQSILTTSFNAFKSAFHHAPPISLRINPSKYKSENTSEKVPWSQYGRYLPSRPIFTLDPLFHAGAYYVQEASSMFLEQAFLQHVNPDAPLKILDLSAAPGGKSTHLLSLMNEESILISNEVIRSRASVLTENIQKWGYMNVVVTNNDPKDFERLTSFFDIVVVDAPCSGEGLFRKDPHAVKEWSLNNVALCSARQKRILEDIWPCLKENGLLIYSTCTYNTLENEDNLMWLKERHDVEFLKIKIDGSWGIMEGDQNGITGYRCYPHNVNGEGFFLSILRKQEKEKEIYIPQKRKKFISPQPKIVSTLSDWVHGHESKKFIQRNENIQILPTLHTDTIELLSNNLRIVTAGTMAASVKHDKIVPEHAMALSTQLNKAAFDTITISKDEAIDYMKKEPIMPQGNPSRGYKLLIHQDIPVGWVNVLDNRVNNLYPTSWRIRM